MNIIDEIKAGENKRLELKETLPSGEAAAKTIVAFSNTSGGKLIIGVNDKREIVGIDPDSVFEMEEKVSSYIYELCHPTILPEIYTLNVEDKLLFVVEVNRGGLLPYFLKHKGKLNGTYVRIGSTNRQADEEMIKDLERQRRGRTYDEEENFDYDVKELDLQPVYKEFEKVGKKIDYHKLKNLRLIKTFSGQDVPTNGLLITLGKFDNTMIKCARFKGTTMDIFIDKKEFEGTIFENLESTLNFLKTHLNLRAEIKGIRRIEEYEIPIEALREAVMNAIIHRDYTRNSDIKVAIFDDIIEIISPGGLPNGITMEDISNGRSELRNRVIAGMFKQLGYIEIWGSGIKKIKRLCDAAGVDFKLEERGNFVYSIFSRGTKKPSQTPDEIKEKLNYRQLKAIEYVKEKGKITNQEYQEINKVSKTTAFRDLQELVDLKIFELIGKTGKGTYYKLKGFIKGSKGS